MSAIFLKYKYSNNILGLLRIICNHWKLGLPQFRIIRINPQFAANKGIKNGNKQCVPIYDDVIIHTKLFNWILGHFRIHCIMSKSHVLNLIWRVFNKLYLTMEYLLVSFVLLLCNLLMNFHSFHLTRRVTWYQFWAKRGLRIIILRLSYFIVIFISALIMLLNFLTHKWSKNKKTEIQTLFNIINVITNSIIQY